MASYAKRLGFLLVAALTVLLTGCAAVQQEINPTQIKSQWLANTATFEQKTITGILVVSIGDSITTDRLLEDAVSNVLTLKGIPSQPSYLYVGNSGDFRAANGGLNMNLLRQTAKKANASDALVIQDGGVESKTVYHPGVAWGPGPLWGPPGPFFGPPMGPGFFFGPDPMYDGWAIPPSVSTLQLRKTTTQLMLASNGMLLWAVNCTTLLDQFDPTRTAELYGDLIFNQLMKNGFMVPLSAPNYQIQPASTVQPR